MKYWKNTKNLFKWLTMEVMEAKYKFSYRFDFETYEYSHSKN